MNKTPLVSFVIPVYKKDPAVFRKCLRSLFDQSLKDVEVIAVFDGPDADLEAVAAEFPHAKKLVIEHGGACKARNIGSEIAIGKYVACWDADCYAKPDMAKRWMQEFDAVPDADFVYSGYEFTNERGGFESEPFDPYSLSCGNYIASMFPIKREKAPKWDETLLGGQDWDFWLTAVEQGCKGVFIEGAGFVTEYGGPGISSVAWAPENRENTIRTIREKHGIRNRDIGVFSMNYTPKALKLARLLGGDLVKSTGPSVKSYRLIMNLGYGPLSRFEDAPAEMVKVQYWLPGEIAGLAAAQYKTVLETVRIAKEVKNFCNTVFEQNKLKELGIDSEVLPLSLNVEELQKTKTDLPKDFSILLVTDDPYAKLLKDVAIDLPHIKFSYGAGKIEDFSCLMSFYTFAALDESILIAHVNGRNVISNVEAPFCGFVDPTLNWDEFKKELYRRIQDVQSLPFNQEAKDYYLALAAPESFKARITSLLAPKFEVVA